MDGSVMSKILYIILVAVMLIISILFSYYPAYLALVLAIQIPLVFLVVLIITRACTKYSISIENTNVIKGDKVRINIEMRNRSPFPSGNIKMVVELYYGNEKRIKKDIYTSVLPFSRRKKQLDIVAEYTGVMVVVCKKAKMFDYLNLFSIRMFRKRKVFKMMILPKPFEIDVTYPVVNNIELLESCTYHPYKKGNDKTEIFNVREYAPGDLMRDVHWKLTNKLDKYMIKEYSLPIKIGLDILVDFTVNNRKLNNIVLQDKILEILYSICTNLSMKQSGFNIVAINRSNGETAECSVTEEEELVFAIADIMNIIVSQGNNETVNESILFEKSVSTNLLYITATISDEFILAVNDMDVNNKLYIIFVALDNKAEIEEKISKLSSDITYLVVDANLKEMGNINEIKL